MEVAVVTVGDELLSGDTVNTNAAWLGSRLAERGVDVRRMVTVPDLVGEIARVVNECRATFDAVIVTGGIGPTHDDVTLEGVAAALGVDVTEHEEAIAWFDDQAQYSHDDLLEGTTHLPEGARMIPNDEGVAPGAVIEGADGVPVYVFPGVPEEMKAMFGRVAEEFEGRPRERAVLETGRPESALIEHFEVLRERFEVQVGSYPGDSVRVTIQGEDPTEVAEAERWLRERLDVEGDEGKPPGSQDR